MAVVMLLDFPGVTEAQYATAWEALSAVPKMGNLVHVAGPTEDGWRVVEVWRSSTLMVDFFQSPSTQAVLKAAGIPAVQPAMYRDSVIAAAACASW